MKIFCILCRLHISDDESNEEEFCVSFAKFSPPKMFIKEFPSTENCTEILQQQNNAKIQSKPFQSKCQTNIRSPDWVSNEKHSCSAINKPSDWNETTHQLLTDESTSTENSTPASTSTRHLSNWSGRHATNTKHCWGQEELPNGRDPTN